MSDYDAAIVGGSIAGSTAATLLARAGAKVALVESHSDPNAYKRMCTHFIQPSATPTIERLGLSAQVERAGGQPSDLNIWTRYGWISFAHEWWPAPLREHPGLNIRRQTFDPMVRRLAGETEGVELMLGHTATALLRDGATGARAEGVLVRTRDGAERELRAKLVIAADGRDSQLAKLAAQPTTHKRNNRFGYFAHYRSTPLVTGASAQMWLLDPDVAYAFPTDGGLTLLACMPHKDRLAEFRADPEGALARLFDMLPDGPRLDPAKRESKVMGKLEMTNIVRRPAAPGLAFVGDAAQASDPLWGVGCGWALQSAEWLADTVAPALGEGPQAIDRALVDYAKLHRRRLAAHERFCSAYSSGRRFNPVEKLIYRGAARDRELAGKMGAMGARWITPQQMLTPATLARLARVNLSRSRRPIGLRRAPAVGDQPGVGSQPGVGNQPGAGSQPGIGSQPGAGSQPGIGSQPGVTDPATAANQASAVAV
jgi:2-polyprenyl-6-methoxyphenol hydroxylase-like FAD-dependent oxidoreductase